MSVKIRAARREDLYELVRFTLGVAKESEGLVPDKSKVQASIVAALEDPRKARYFVAESIDGNTRRLVGSLFVTFEWSDWRNGWYWWIQAAYVVPEQRGTGIFRLLYEAVHAAAKAEGDVRRVRLYVEADNEAGLATYRSLGMEETHYRIFEADV